MLSCRNRVILLSLAAILLFVVWAGRSDITTPHEARVTQVARRMAESGWTWAARPMAVTEVHLREISPGVQRLLPREDGRMLSVNPWMIPVIGSNIRLQKPPLPYWCTATAFRVLGTNEFAARVTPAALGAISVLLFYSLAVQLFGRRGGWLATLVYLTSYFVSQEYRKVMADPYLAFFTLMAIWTWVQGRCRGSIGMTLLFYLALALGALAKGPVIFVHAAVPVILWEIFVQRRLGPLKARVPRRAGFDVVLAGDSADRPISTPEQIVQRDVDAVPPGRTSRTTTASGGPTPATLPPASLMTVRRRMLAHLLGVVIFVAIALPWPIYVISHVPGATELWRYESVGELSDNVENARPFWFYLPNLFYLVMPWTPLWIVGLIWPLVHDRRRLWFAWTWCFVMVAFFSVVNLKKDAYLLPVMPAAALMSGPVLRRLMAAGRSGRHRAAFLTLAIIQGGVGLVAGGALVIGLLKLPVLAGLAAIVGLLIFAARGRPVPWLRLQVVVYLCVLLLYLDAWAPLSRNKESARHFAPAAMAAQTRTGLKFLPEQVTEGMSFYFPLDIPTAATGESHVLAIRRPKKGDAVATYPDPAWQATIIPLEPAKRMNGLVLYELKRPGAPATAPAR